MARIYIDLGKDPHPARSAATGITAPDVAGVLGAPLDLEVVFFDSTDSNAIQELAGSTTGQLVIKAPLARAGAALALDVTITKTGTGTDTVYTFGAILNSDELVAALAEMDWLTCKACVTWKEPGEDERKCLDFDLIIHNSAARPDDTIPATTAARWGWIKDTLAVGGGLTIDENDITRVITLGLSVRFVLNGESTALEVFSGSTSLGFLHLQTAAP